jgi:hypothetical protein
MTRKRKHPLILTSNLTSSPRYYVTRAWKATEQSPDQPERYLVEVTGEKFDVTDQIEAIIKQRREADDAQRRLHVSQGRSGKSRGRK